MPHCGLGTLRWVLEVLGREGLGCTVLGRFPHSGIAARV